MMSAIADTVNIVEPMPPRPRNSSSCQYVCAAATAYVEAATMRRPAT
jgi:hypothetical protein